jgi:hypothetical protein
VKVPSEFRLTVAPPLGTPKRAAVIGGASGLVSFESTLPVTKTCGPVAVSLAATCSNVLPMSS